ncbi:MAG: substrate-binding domain-containing protein [Lachnospiraceae bacterium]|nr:substrate-binding domain-containing protein [Lachnospiraceae bacterium]
MKKKVLALLLGTCMVASLLAGCGSGDKPADANAGNDANAGDDANAGGNDAAGGDDANAGGDAAGGDDANAGGGDTAGGDFNFEIIVKSYQSSYWQAAVTGINQEAEKLGVKVNCTGPNAETDIADQVNMLNNAINNTPDGIGLAACDANSVLDSLQTAMDKGIPVVCFDSGVPDAPEGSVLSTVATDNYAAGETAAENLYAALKDKIASATEPVRIGEVNQEATSESITSRGLGFIDKMTELVTADGKKVAVVGHDYYVSGCKDKGDEATADVIIEVAVPAQTTVELCATEASNIMNKADLIGIFGSNQVAAEGILTANSNLKVLGSDPASSVLAAGFDAGSTIKAAVKDGTMFGAVTQSPLAMGITTVDTLVAIAKGETVSDVPTQGYWYNAENMEDDSIAPNLYD